MKNALLIGFLLCCVSAFSYEDAEWMAIARKDAANGSLFDVKKTADAGICCLVLVEMDESGEMNKREREGAAEQEAKRQIAAYVHGETMSANRRKEDRTVEKNGQAVEDISVYTEYIESKLDAFMRGIRVLGQVSSEGSRYMVCLAVEKTKDQTEVLARAQAQGGGPDVVNAVGVAETRDEALQKAKESALEQVLGSVVVNRAVTDSKTGFRSKTRSGTDGMIESFRILSEERSAEGVRVTICAKVLKENPFNKNLFYIEAPVKAMSKRMSEIFSESGVRVAETAEDATHIVRCTVEFETIVHPTTGREGTRMNCGLRVQDIRSGEQYMNLEVEKPATVFVGAKTRQKELCVQKAVKDLLPQLQEAIPEMIARIKSRTSK